MANAQVNVRFVPNGRGGQYLVFMGFRFSIKSRRTDRIHWRCCVKNCSATINTQNNIVTTYMNCHVHEAENDKIREFLVNLKELGRTTSTPIPTLYKEKLSVTTAERQAQIEIRRQRRFGANFGAIPAERQAQIGMRRQRGFGASFGAQDGRRNPQEKRYPFGASFGGRK